MEDLFYKLFSWIFFIMIYFINLIYNFFDKKIFFNN